MRIARNLFTLGIAAAVAAPTAAVAQTYVNSEFSQAWTDLAQIPGVSGLQPFTSNFADDGVTQGLPIGFSFSWLGAPVDTVYVSTNGFMGFQSAGFTAWGNDDIPDTNDPNNFIAPWWDDLVAPSTSFGSYATVGAAPNRIFVVEARSLTAYAGSANINWQVWLYEGGAGRFEVRVSGSANAAPSATTGYEGPTAEPAHKYRNCTPACVATDFTAMVGKVYRTQIANDPELTGEIGRFPRGAFPGESASGEIVLRNLGVDTASTVVWNLFLSTDANLDGSDLLVGSGTVAAVLGGNRPTSTTAVVSVPAGTAVADYTMLLFVDAPNVFNENNELDNVIASTSGFATGYDLEPTDITSSDGANPGDPITFDVEITNHGVPRIGAVEIEIYASTDQIFDATDTLIVADTVTLAGNNVEAFQIGANLPQLSPGTYHPIIVVDPSDVLNELNEINNSFASAAGFPTGPDFTISAITAPVQVAPGGQAAVQTTIASVAVPYTGQVDYRLYASEDQTVDGMDTILGNFIVDFAGDAQRIDSRTLTWPMSLPPGAWYVIARADGSGSIPEIDETNNDRSTTDSVSNAFDFQVANVSAPSEAEPGNDINVTAQLRSVGIPYVGNLAYRVYLSSDRTFDPGDESIYDGSVFVPGLSTTAIDVTFALPRTVLVRAFYVIVVADPPPSALPESDETNNWGASTDTMSIQGADLYVEDITGPEFGFIGLPYPVELTVGNAGIADARSFQYAIYVSDNDIIRVTDTRVFVSDTATIAAGGRQSFQASITLPTYTSTRSVYLGVIVDIFSQVPEDREGNNVRGIQHPVRVVFPIPDLTAGIIETATAAAAGEELAVTRILRNEGVAPAPQFDYTYYLSSNPTISIDDTPVGTFSNGLDDGADDFGIDILQLPSNLPAGNYYLGLLVDADEQVEEVREDNNAAVGPELAVFGAALRFSTDRLPMATVGIPYETGVYASGGPLGQRWTVQSGDLPLGLSIGEATGIISGTPTQEGLSEFVLRTSSGTAYADKAFAIRVVVTSLPLVVATGALDTAVSGRSYRQALIAAGGQAPYTWRAISMIPPGLTLSGGGVLSGSPTAPGNYRVTVTVTDDLGASANATWALHVINANDAVAIEQLALPIAEVGKEYCDPDSVTFDAVGGIEPYTWAIVGDGIDGMTLDVQTGALCGVPERAGRFPLTVRAQDTTGMYDTALFFVTVDDGTELAVSTTRLPDGLKGTSYEQGLSVIRGAEPYTWTLAQSTALPPGLNLDQATGTIAGTPTEAGLFVFAVQVVDADQRSDVAPLSISIIATEDIVKPIDEGCGCSTTPTTDGGPAGLLAFLCLAALVLVRRRSGLLAVPLAALVLAVGASSAMAQTPVPGTPYQMARRNITYNHITGATTLFSSGADTNVDAVGLPFSFKYYETFFDTVSVGMNGAVLMGTNTRLSDFNSSPGTSTPNGLIAPFWDDLYISAASGGSVSWTIEGAAPQRVAVFQWKDVDRYPNNGPRMNFQIRLYEGPSGRIQIRYGSVGTSVTMSGTMAMEDEAGGRLIYFDTDTTPCTNACNFADLSNLSNTEIDLIQDPGVELVALAIEAPSFGFLGAPMAVPVIIGNLHGNSVGPFQIAIEVSRSRDMSNATSIYTSPGLTFSPFLTDRRVVQATPPQTLTEGEYYIGLVVDSANSVTEVAEDNNRAVSVSRVRLLEGKPDLAVTQVRMDRTRAQAGDSVTVMSTVANIGAEPASNVAVAVVLSTNQAISRQDVELGSFTVSLAAGETITTTTSVDIPATINSGTYWLGTFADSTATIDELSESNNGRAALRALTITGGNLAIVTARLPQGYVGVTYVALLNAVGGDSVYDWQITQGSLPMGLGHVPATGEIFGRPLNAGTQSFEVSVTSDGDTVTKMLTLEIADPQAPLTIVSRRAPPAVVGQEYTHQLLATGGVMSSTYTWSASGVPDGLVLTPAGLLAGTPGVAGSSTMAVSLSDGTSMTSRDVEISVRDNANLLIDPVVLPNAEYMAPYSAQLTASGGVPPLTWVVKNGNLPEGVSLSTGGVLMGSPTQVQEAPYRFVVEVRDSASGALAARDANTFELKVDDVTGFTITTDGALPNAVVSREYNQSIESTGGIAPIQWSVLSGRLPDGITTAEIPQTGAFQIFGAAKSPNTHNLLVRAVDSHGRIAIKAFALRIVEETTSDAPTPTPMDEGCTCVSTPGPRPSSAGLLAGLLALGLFVRRRR